MKRNYLLQLLLFAFLLGSCDREQDVPHPQDDPLMTKMSVKLLSPGSLPFNEAEMSYDFSYDPNRKLIKRTGGFLPVSGASGFNFIYFTKLIETSLVYTGNTVVVENFSTSPDFSVQKNSRTFTLNAQQQIEVKEIPAQNSYSFKREFYLYKNGKLDEIKTTFPNMPYDPTDPNDYVFTFSEKFYYDSAGNLAKTEYVELQDDVNSGYYKRVRTFENYDNSYNPFKHLTLLDEYFYRSLSKNNFRVYKEEVTEYGSTSTSQRDWTFSYDASGNIIVN